MPRITESGNRIYLGIDPGASGGLAEIGAVTHDGDRIVSMPKTEGDVWSWFDGWKHIAPDSVAKPFAIIEQQIPRPTFFKGHASILKSTCLLYGSYMQLRGMLLAARIPFEAVIPQTWQKAFGLVKKKGESPTKWKNRLKAKAQQLFPSEKVTLATADALLIAEFCRRKCEGRI